MPKLNTTTFERNFRQLLDEEKEIDEQISRLQERRTVVSQKIDAYRLVSEECEDSPAENGMVTPDELRNLSLKDALVMLAERNAGELNIYQTRPLLITAGLLRGDSPTVSSRLHDAVVGSKRFEKTGERGRWRLLDKPSEIGDEKDMAQKLTEASDLPPAIRMTPSGPSLNEE